MEALTTAAILEKLIAFKTVSNRSNLDLIAWIEAYLHHYGIETQRIDVTADKASLVAKIGTGSQGGLVLSGHTDVVPVVGQPWSHDPFTLHETKERYYGRGVCDMKGFIACVLAQVPEWQALPLKKPVYLALTRDEEIGCLGAAAMADYLAKQSSIKPWVVVGEPTLMQPVVAQKGITTFRTTVYGEAAHSSQVGQGVSAVHVAASLVQAIENVMDELVAVGAVDQGFNVPFSSLHVGTIHGGTAVNIKARECTFDWEIRHLPTQTMEAVKARVDAKIAELEMRYPSLSIQTTVTCPTVPGLANRDHQQLLQLVSHHLPADYQTQYVAYATEAGMFQQYGFEAIILGPGSIRQAHQPDEWIDKKQLVQCGTFLQNIVAEACL